MVDNSLEAAAPADSLHELMRSPDIVMRPERLAAHWQTRLSFARRLLARMCAERWRIVPWRVHLDELGRGEAIYRVATPGSPLFVVFFSDVLAESERDDRVIADRWDVAGALTEIVPTPATLNHMRANVPRQEYGRALAGTLVWTRGNRSSRYFDYVVDCLAAGRQPDVAVLAEGGYLIRSTAYYGNGKFGLKSYEAIGEEHPLFGSFMPQMLTAFVLREFSFDLVDHLAQAQNSQAVPLAPALRRFVGIGNATGMGLVPFVINHPQITDRWLRQRETALARVRVQQMRAGDRAVNRFQSLLARARTYFRSDTCDDKGLFASASSILADIDRLQAQLAQLASANSPQRLWHNLMLWAESELQLESQELLLSMLLEIYPEVCADLAADFEVSEVKAVQPAWTVAQLQHELAERYQWALAWPSDLSSRQNFWYFSADSEEPLIGRRGVDAGESVERPLDIPQRVQALARDLADCAPLRVGHFLALFPEHRFIVARIQATAGLPYAEIHTNLLGADCIPLHLQRFQLAMYGMARFNPQSTKWVRVTLMQGAPIAADVAAGGDPDWFLPLRPDLEVVDG